MSVRECGVLAINVGMKEHWGDWVGMGRKGGGVKGNDSQLYTTILLSIVVGPSLVEHLSVLFNV